MTRIKALIFLCDAPECTVQTISHAGDGRDVHGYHGTVTNVDVSGGVDAGDWFACKESHVAPAICEVVARAWDKETSEVDDLL